MEILEPKNNYQNEKSDARLHPSLITSKYLGGSEAPTSVFSKAVKVESHCPRNSVLGGLGL